MNKELYAKVVEDNGGGLALYVMGTDDTCIYAHSGYEDDREPGRLVEDLKTLAETDSVSDWDGNEEEMVAGWEDLDLGQIGIDVIAELTDGKLATYPKKMGAAGKREFGIETE